MKRSSISNSSSQYFAPSQSGDNSTNKLNKKKILIFLASVFVFLFAVSLVGYLNLYRPLMSIKNQALALKTKATELKAIAKEKDLEKLNLAVNDVQNQYSLLATDIHKLQWATHLPWLGKYFSDAIEGAQAGTAYLQAIQKSIKAISPYADLIGFKQGGQSFADKSADDRIASAVLTLDKLTASVDEIAADVDKAEKHLEHINPQDYPEELMGRPVRELLSQNLSSVNNLSKLFVDAAPLIKKLPDLLGAKSPQTYLILFQNDTELRPTGGFLTAYALFKIDKGRFEVVKNEDIYTLDAGISKRPPIPSSILEYHKGVKTYFIRDSNLSPDFPTSVKLFEELYASSKEVKNYQGVIAMDTQVLVDTLRVLGETSAGGKSFKADTDPRCDCPQVIYTLLDDIDRPVGYLKADRKGILGDFLYEIMKKALSSSPSQYWGPLAKEMIRNLQEKHILMNFKDTDTQKAAELVDFAGKISQVNGDFLHISDTNFAGAKSNLFVQHSINSKTIFDGENTKRELIIEYKNPHKHSDCNLERGGLCLNATLRDWVRIYVPKGSKLASFVGSLKDTKVYDDLGYTVFEGFTQVEPEGKTTLTVKYSLPNNIDQEKYTLDIIKQPGTKGHALQVNIGGKNQKTNLKTDMKFTR